MLRISQPRNLRQRACVMANEQPESGEVRQLALYVQILEAKPNKMFSEDQRALVRFLRYNKSVPCAECGRRKRIHWTMLCSFQAYTMAAIVPKKSGKVHLPLTPVCQHLLAPELVPLSGETPARPPVSGPSSPAGERRRGKH